MRNLWTAEEALFHLNIANLAATAPVSVADERQLIQLMLAGKKAAKELAHRSSLTSARRKRLAALKEEGAAARRELIQTNGRLVVKVLQHRERVRESWIESIFGRRGCQGASPISDRGGIFRPKPPARLRVVGITNPRILGRCETGCRDQQ